MLGERGAQRGLFEADHQYLEAVGTDSFYGFLAKLRGELFKDEDFARLYKKIGRPSVPPSLLATALLLQTYDRVSDEEAKRRADFDVCWKVAMGIAIEERPFAKSTLQFFRAQLVVNEEAGTIPQEPRSGPRAGLHRPQPEDEGGPGHDKHPGPGCGEGHLQPPGRRHRPRPPAACEAGR
jgi:hypothetical protein